VRAARRASVSRTSLAAVTPDYGKVSPLGIALRDPKMLKRIAEFGGTPLSLTAAEFRKLVSDETDR